VAKRRCGAHIKGSVDVQDREGSIEIIGLSHGLNLPVDSANGKITGTSTPSMRIEKEVDSSTPYLYKAASALLNKSNFAELKDQITHPPDNTDHSVAKQKFRITNWSTYNKALINRGSLTFWLDDERFRPGMSGNAFITRKAPALF
jgi:hypothetical protein